jgi:hypothetical protein
MMNIRDKIARMSHNFDPFYGLGARTFKIA